MASDPEFSSCFDTCVIQPVQPYNQLFPSPNSSPIAPSMASTSSPAPLTPMSLSCPSPSQNGQFELRSYVEGEKRVWEIGVHGDLPPSQHLMAVRVLHFSLDVYFKLVECLCKPCDLKVAVNARAELCELLEAKFNQTSARLQFSIPDKCECIISHSVTYANFLLARVQLTPLSFGT